VAVPPLSPVDELGMLAAESDLVVLGKIGTGISRMTADKDFCIPTGTLPSKSNENQREFTSLSRSHDPRHPARREVAGERSYGVRTCGDFLDFATGQEYLLYLRYVSETGAYASGGWEHSRFLR